MPGPAADRKAPPLLSVLAIVPARGGSKGVPGKNERRVAGFSLVERAIQVALDSPSLSRVVVSTDSERIKAQAEDAGAHVPFMRPEELARDSTAMLPVLQHAVAALAASGDQYDAVCLLQPTSPLRSVSLVEECVERLRKDSSVDASVSVRRVPHEYHPSWTLLADPSSGKARWAMGEEPISRRQDLPLAVHRDGGVYCVRRDVLMSGSLYGSRLSFVLNESDPWVNIDTEADWDHYRRVVEGT